MGKKKLSLKPVQRGFATSSVASKKTAQLLDDSTQDLDQSTTASGPNALDAVAVTSTEGQHKVNKVPIQDWEDEKADEVAALQSLVDRLQEKGDKEVSRILKVIDYDKRLAASFPRFEINQDVRDRVLELALEEDKDEGCTERVETLTPTSSSLEEDKLLLRIFVAHHVLSKLGFTDDRISQCILEGIGESDGWEEALTWMWLHLSEDECLGRGDYAPTTDDRQESDAPLGESVPVEEPPIDDFPIPNNLAPTPALPSFQATSLFQPLDDSNSDSDVDPDINRDNESWARLTFELENLRIAVGASQGRGKGKKIKSNGVVLESVDMRRLKDKIAKVEKEYLFNRKDADILLKVLRDRREAVALEKRLKGDNTTAQFEEPLERAVDVVESSNEEGGVFGNMLDGPAYEPGSEGPTNSTITVLSMPIPKQFSFGGNVPKALLRSSLAKTAKQAVISYAKLCGGSRAARAGVEICWSDNRRRVWRMIDVGCDDMSEAENYVSTLALSELSANGDVLGINWKTMPPAYRQLWEELESERRLRDDETKRQFWSKIKSLVKVKTKITVGVVEHLAFRATVPLPVDQAMSEHEVNFDARLKIDFENRQASTLYQAMRRHRDGLPIASFRQDILSTLESSQVMVLSGETGCGKSTQLPSFILEDQLAKGRPCKVFVTEPRRISAISLAQRVSQELGDAPGKMGTGSSLVGYSIRLEARMSPATRLAFVTNGIALRMLESGSSGGSGGTAFDQVTHIIVDEVHERSIESDFLLIVLKSLIQQRKDLKVVLMSATVDAEKISNFFGGCPFFSVPGRTFPVQVNYLEDAVEVADWHIDESSQYAIRSRNVKTGAKQLEWTEEGVNSESDDEEQDPTKLSAARYSARTASTVNMLDTRQIPYDLIVRLLEKICFEDLSSFSQATLVFLPGLAEIRRLNDMLQGHPAFGSDDFIIYPLHSTISSEGQSAVFDPTPVGIRKIVISTNIAETGVTIPDVTCVIDSGKHREIRYDEKRQISRLVETYIARSNAKQRRGRAGRVQEGLAFHLFTKARHDTQLAEHPVPEMLRLSLQDLALRIKILKIKLGTSVEDVLLRALDPPSPANIQRAIAALIEVKALTALEEITPMGRLLSKLPMDVHLGKFLLVAALFRCLDPALTIAATLNSKSPFITPFGFEGAADAAKKSFAIGHSDFFTIVNVFNSWRTASDNPGFVRVFCKRNFVSQQNLQQIEELRQQLLAYLVDSSFIQVDATQRQAINNSRYSRGVRTRFVSIPPELNIHADNAQILSGALAAGLYPKILSLDGNGMRTLINQQPVSIHPSSVNFRTPRSELGSSFLIYFTIMQSKKLYAWETGPVNEKALALLCGDQADVRLPARSLQIDKKIRYQVDPKTALAINLLRQQFAAAMSTRLRGRALSKEQETWFDLGLSCLKTDEL